MQTRRYHSRRPAVRFAQNTSLNAHSINISDYRAARPVWGSSPKRCAAVPTETIVTGSDYTQLSHRAVHSITSFSSSRQLMFLISQSTWHWPMYASQHYGCQLTLLSQMLEARRNLAQLAGWPSFASKVHRICMIENPNNANEFLGRMAAGFAFESFANCQLTCMTQHTFCQREGSCKAVGLH